jgi:hypothetical protein
MSQHFRVHMQINLLRDSVNIQGKELEAKRVRSPSRRRSGLVLRKLQCQQQMPSQDVLSMKRLFPDRRETHLHPRTYGYVNLAVKTSLVGERGSMACLEFTQPTSFPPFPYPQICQPALSPIQDTDDQPSVRHPRRNTAEESETKSTHTARGD